MDNPKNHGKKWDTKDEALLAELIPMTVDINTIAEVLWRTPNAIFYKVCENREEIFDISRVL